MESAAPAPTEARPEEVPAPPDEQALPMRKGGRPAKASRPKIDIDHEIDEANRMAEITKKMMLAAKAAQRNSRRAKQRLVRRAGKLSAADLERLAVLKRCGLYLEGPAPASPETSTAPPSSAASSLSSRGSPAPSPSVASMKLLNAMGKVDGAAELLQSFGSNAGSEAGLIGSSGSASSGARTSAISAVPRGCRMGPRPQAVVRPASRPVAASVAVSAARDLADFPEDEEMEDKDDEP